MELNHKIHFMGATPRISASEIIVGKTTRPSRNVLLSIAYAAVIPPMQAMITNTMGTMPKRFASQLFQKRVNDLFSVFIEFVETITCDF